MRFVHVSPARQGMCNELAEKVYAEYQEAENTQVLDRSHIFGIWRGLVAEWAAAYYLAGRWSAGERGSVDVLLDDGTRIDVKAGKKGRPLMVPVDQLYKVDPKRIDRILLAFWKPPATVVELKGWVTPRRFLAQHRVDSTLPRTAAIMEPSELEWVPRHLERDAILDGF